MTRATWLAILWTVLILVLCWMPPRQLPISEGAPSIFRMLHADKVVHAGMFAVFAFVWRRTGPASTARLVGLAGLALAVVTELGQGTRIVGRDADFWDGAADVAGVLLGLIAYRLSRKPTNT